MATLFQLDKENSAILHPECAKLCPELKKLTKDELLFVILAYDYKSPYHSFPEDERIRKAERQVWSNKDEKYSSSVRVKNAIGAYRSLQYDTRRETIRNYREKIVSLNKQLMEETSPTKIKTIADTIKLLESEAEKTQESVDKTELDYHLRGGGKKSLIEEMQENRELFKLARDGVSDAPEIEVAFPDDYEE